MKIEMSVDEYNRFSQALGVEGREIDIELTDYGDIIWIIGEEEFEFDRIVISILLDKEEEQ